MDTVGTSQRWRLPHLGAWSAISLALVAILLLPAALAHADEPVPIEDYIVDVGDGRYLFVMLAPDSAVIDEIQATEIRAQYGQSGLYEVGEAGDPLWSVDWYAADVEITPDGKHLVRWGPWPSIEGYDELALEFYENGELLSSYRVSDLVAAPQKLPRTVSHLNWIAESDFRGEEGELYLRTQNGEEHLFDVTTGGIQKRAPVRIPLCPILAGIVLLGPAARLFGRRNRLNSG